MGWTLPLVASSGGGVSSRPRSPCLWMLPPGGHPRRSVHTAWLRVVGTQGPLGDQLTSNPRHGCCGAWPPPAPGPVPVVSAKGRDTTGRPGHHRVTSGNSFQRDPPGCTPWVSALPKPFPGPVWVSPLGVQGGRPRGPSSKSRSPHQYTRSG